MDMEPLFIFMDLEAAHGNVYFGDIIEIAAQVDPRVLENNTFSRLVNTKQSLSYFVLHVCNISGDMLKGKKYFPEVFNEFLQWVDTVVQISIVKKRKVFYPVLVAHGGFDMDFMMIQSNMERNEMDLDVLIEKNIHFADTYYFLRKARLDGLVSSLTGCRLSIEALFKKLHPKDKFIGQHRALADVKFMIKIFLETQLKDIFHKIPIATYKSRNEAFHAKHTSVTETNLLNSNLPKDLAKVTHTMTLKRLLRNGITYSQLQILFKNSISFLDFFDRLNDLGIDRKAAKSIALRLSSMGLTCSGEVDQDNRNEVGDTDEDTDSVVDNDTDLVECCPTEGTIISRSDSGYESNSPNNEELDRFYNMFVDEFFFPPDVYEYNFGEFSFNEIENLDNDIADLFDSRFPEYYESEDYLGPCGETNLVTDISSNNSETDTIKSDLNLEVEECNNTNSSIEEKWDDELPEECEDFIIPTDHGRLGKVVPIGMTMDDFNGECYSGKVPLFKHFESVDLSSRPKGGIPKMSGKKGFYDRKRLHRENKKLQKELDICAINDGSQTLVKSTKSGEVFLLV